MTGGLFTAGGLVGALALAAAAALAGWLVTRWVVAYLTRRAVLDYPNERSSHSAPTPRGGGIGILAVALPLIAALFALRAPGEPIHLGVLGLTWALAILSWFDDLRGLPLVLRLMAHVGAVAAAGALMPEKLLVFQGLLPLWADRIAAALAWVWFLNLYNFMDGIDGLAGVETIAVGAGLFAVLAAGGGGAGAGGAGIALAQAGLVIAGAGTGFLVLNWQPARVFMGDVGAVAIGYLLGWFLLLLAAWGFWTAALILPAYYLADATITLARRAVAGEPIWRAHAKHFYQRAVQRGLTHARVARFVAMGNVGLILIAVASALTAGGLGALLCLAAAAAIVAWMLFWLARAKPLEGAARR